MKNVATESQFEERLKGRLGEHYDRALNLFQVCGEFLSWNIINVLHRSADEEKVIDVLSVLENHWREHLQFQSMSIRGSIGYETLMMFLSLYQDVLQTQNA